MFRRILPFLILLAAFAPRTWQLNEVPPGLTHDEAGHGHDAAYILKGVTLIYFTVGYGREPAFDYVNAGMIAGLGARPFTLRFSAVLWSLITLAATYRAAYLAVNRQTAILAMAFMAAAFWPLATSRQILRSDMLPAEMALAAILYLEVIRSGRNDGGRIVQWLAAAGLGLTLAASLYTYIPARLLWVMFPLAWLFGNMGSILAARSAGAALRSFAPLGAALALAACLATPLFLYLRQNPEVEQRIGMLAQPLQTLAAGNPASLLANAGEFGLGLFLPGHGDYFLAYNLPGQPIYDDPITALLALGGLGWLITVTMPGNGRMKTASAGSSLLLLWLILGAAPSIITGPEAQTTRLIGAQPVFYILPAIGLSGLWILLRRWPSGGSRRGKGRRGAGPQPARWVPGVLAGLLFAGLGNYNLSNYFVAWANRPDVRAAYQSTLMAMLESVHGPTIVSTVYPAAPHDPYIGELLSTSETRWVDARYAIILRTAEGSGDPAWQMVAPASATLHPFFTSFFRQRLKVSLRAGDLDPYFTVYQQLEFRDVQPDAVRPPLNGALQLRGARWLAETYRPGDRAEIFTGWQVLDPSSLGALHPPAFKTNLNLFTHILNADGTIYLQQDRLDAPSWDWQRGDAILQIHQIDVPADAIPGQYPVEVGFYDRITGERLTVAGSNAGSIPAPPLNIRP